MIGELSETLIVECAESLGACRVPVEAIQKAWGSVGGYGCLNNDNGKRLFIAYRLREMGCFDVGCQLADEFPTGCFFHFFDIHHDTKNLTDEEYAEFMNYRQTDSGIAATKFWKLIDSEPINAVAARATLFHRKGKKS